MSEKDIPGLNEDIRLTREHYQLTQAEFAEALGCSIGKIQNIEAGLRELKLSEYKKFMQLAEKSLVCKQGVILDDHFTVDNMKKRIMEIINKMLGGGNDS